MRVRRWRSNQLAATEQGWPCCTVQTPQQGPHRHRTLTCPPPQRPRRTSRGQHPPRAVRVWPHPLPPPAGQCRRPAHGWTAGQTRAGGRVRLCLDGSSTVQPRRQRIRLSSLAVPHDLCMARQAAAAAPHLQLGRQLRVHRRRGAQERQAAGCGRVCAGPGRMGVLQGRCPKQTAAARLAPGTGDWTCNLGGPSTTRHEFPDSSSAPLTQQRV